MSGSRASQIADKGTGGNALTASNNRAFGIPVLPVQASLGMRPGAWLDGNNGYWNCTSLALDDFTSTWFLVANFDAITGGTQGIIGPTDVGSLTFFLDSTGHLNCGKHGTPGQAVFTSAAITPGTSFVYAVIVDAATSITQYMNLTSDTDATSLSVTGSHAMFVGTASFVAGANGWYAELLVYNSVLSQVNTEATISYLMAKWGIS